MRALPSSLPILLGLSLLAAPALAQQTPGTPTQTLTFQVPTGRTHLSQQACLAGETVGATVSYTGAIQSGIGAVPPQIRVYRSTSGNCPERGAVNDTGDQAEVIRPAENLTESNRTFTLQLTATQLGGDGCPANKEESRTFCAVVNQPPSVSTTQNVVLAAQSLSLGYDAVPPAAAEITSVQGGERSLYVRWRSGTASSFTIFYRPVTDGSAPATTGHDNHDFGALGMTEPVMGEDGGREGQEAYGLTPELLRAILEALDQQDLSRLEALVVPLHAADVADLLEQITPAQCALVLEVLKPEINPDILAYLGETTLDQVREILGTDDFAG
ncbi:MAG: hypothetical protein ACK4N5_06710, partial [Myxococcales bacterium]